MVESKAGKWNGFVGLLIVIILLGAGVYCLIQQLPVIGVPLVVIAILISTGLTIVQPNQTKAVMFFGRYLGNVGEPGLWMTVPFSIRKNVSLRVRNFNSKTLKVNDVEGNPIEIAAVVVFKVVDSAKALFDVDNYEEFVEIQSETALRHIASQYPYDVFNDVPTDGGYSLRGNTDEIAQQLVRELQERLQVAGVNVIEARLIHLAYSTEIASAMLQRQQATAIIAARQKIVDGAVGMVQMAIEQLEKDGTVQLDEERKAAMVNNLMVAIVSDRGATPVVNAGTLY